jgi:hypothetical protein
MTLHPKEDGPAVAARTTNLGVGGVHCLTDVPLAVGQELPVSLRLTPDRSFDCRAEVVRTEANVDDPTGREVVLGLRFVDLAETEQATLALALAALAADVDENSVPREWRDVVAAAEAEN